MAPKDLGLVPSFSFLFRDLFRNTSTFYVNKTYKYQKPRFPTFFKKLKECIHTCTFYVRKTDKCAVTVFTILNKKLNVKNLTYRTLQGMILSNFSVGWHPFGSLLVPFGSRWSYFGSILNCLRCRFALFGSLLVPKSLKEPFGTLSAKHPEKITGTLTFASNRPYGPGAEPCRRQIRPAPGPKAPWAC